MRHLPVVFFAALTALAACGDDKHGAVTPDAGSNNPPDAPPDSAPLVPDGIKEARAATDGANQTLAIHHVVVTYIKPQVNTTTDPAGFTIQASKEGPALFISVDPASLSPAPAVGDTVDFTITTMGTVGMQRRALALSDFNRVAQGANVGNLAQDISAATDLVSAVDNYDSELVTISGTAFEDFVGSGTNFKKSGFNTTGITNDTNLQLRAPQALVDAIDMAKGCTITATNVTMGRFNLQAQIGVFSASDVTLTNCPAPVVASATALSATSIRVDFSRNIKASSFLADGSQFTFDNGLTVSAAALTGRSVTLTTSNQVVGTTYALTVAQTLTDLQGTALTTNTANILAFAPPAVVRINELNANIGSSCDLIEIRVIADGSLTNFKVNDRAGAMLTFPSFTVKKNDLIVLHLSSGSATCNPGTASQETTSPTDQPKATFGANFDTAFDFYSAQAGLVASTNTFTITDPAGAIVDAVFVTDLTTAAAAATLTAAGVIGTANAWQPAQATYTSAEFIAAAVDDLNATGTTATGNSIQRLNDNDTDAKADWTSGTGAASTFGALNANQSAL
jgi:hypothetical protein